MAVPCFLIEMGKKRRRKPKGGDGQEPILESNLDGQATILESNLDGQETILESNLDRLPLPVLQAILARLDVASICSASASCHLLKSCASQALRYLPSFDMEDFLPDKKLLKQLLSFNTSLRSLKLDCSYLDDRCITLLLKPCLRELHLQGCDDFSEVLLLEIGRTCQNIRSLLLDLGWQTKSFRSGLEHLLKGCSSLETLSLRFSGRCFDGGALESVPQLIAPTVKHLELGCITEEDATCIISNNGNLSSRSAFIKLERLSLMLDNISDSLMTIIAGKLPFLLELELCDEPEGVGDPLLRYDLTNNGIQKIGSCTRLCRLSIVRLSGSYKRVNDLGFLLMIEQCKYLKSITLGGFSRITDASCRAILHNCRALETFELLRTAQLTDLAFHDLAATPLALTSVNLTSCPLISDCSIKHLTYCESLETLDLRGCRSVGDDSLYAISDLMKLKKLVLNGSDVSDFGLVALGKGKTPLVSIALRNCHRITDDGVAALLDGCITETLTSLDLSCIPQLTDRTVLSLVRSGIQVVELRLRECPFIGDTSVIALASMHFQNRYYGGTLKLLDLWNCKGITKVSLLWFKKPYFPRLRWLGLGGTLTEVLDDRPMVHLVCEGNELGHGMEREMDMAYSRPDEEDELERWLRDEGN